MKKAPDESWKEANERARSELVALLDQLDEFQLQVFKQFFPQHVNALSRKRLKDALELARNTVAKNQRALTGGLN